MKHLNMFHVLWIRTVFLSKKWERKPSVPTLRVDGSSFSLQQEIKVRVFKIKASPLHSFGSVSAHSIWTFTAAMVSVGRSFFRAVTSICQIIQLYTRSTRHFFGSQFYFESNKVYCCSCVANPWAEEGSCNVWQLSVKVTRRTNKCDQVNQVEVENRSTRMRAMGFRSLCQHGVWQCDYRALAIWLSYERALNGHVVTNSRVYLNYLIVSS